MIARFAHWVVWAALFVVVGIITYRESGWFKPVADKAIAGVRSVVGNGPVIGESLDSKLSSARSAFTGKEFERAIVLYGEYVKGRPKDPDAHGELGNVLYMTGQLTEAAQSFYEAANILLEKGEYDRVEYLLPAIARGDPKLADEVTLKLREAMGTWTAPRGAEPLRRSPQSALTRH